MKTHMRFALFLFGSSLLTVACEQNVLVGMRTDAGAADGGDSDAGQRSIPPDGGVLGAADAGIYTATLADVSILFPLPQSQTELATMLRPTSTGRGGTLLPKSVFDAIAPPGEVLAESINWATLAVVALRIDPCAAQLTPGASSCDNQLRLTFQPLTWAGTATRADDSAVHVFYSLTRAELTRLVKALIDLRKENADGTPLDRLEPHRLMLAQGANGPMANGVRALIRETAGEQRLKRIAVMGSLSQMIWNFTARDVDPSTLSTEVQPIAGTDGGEQVFDRAFTYFQSLEATVFPSSTQPDDFSLFYSSSEAVAASASAREAAYEAMLRVENPLQTTALSVDCVSCHVATPLRLGGVEPRFTELTSFGNPETYAAPTPWVEPNSLIATVQDFSSFGNLHAFSYVRTEVGISQRTVNESAEVVRYLNEKVFFSPRP